MGGQWSSLDREASPDPWWPSQQSPSATTHVAGDEVATEPARGKVRQEELEEFKQELARKRALRQEALAALQEELKELRQRVELEKNLRQQAEQERDRLKSEGVVTEERVLQEQEKRLEVEVRVDELEKEREEKKKLLEERERLMAELEEKAGLQRQIQALKNVSEIGKEMLRIRELQVKELKKKLVEINISSVMAPPEDLRVEYEKQIENIRKLRTLYEERAAATLNEHRRELEREEARIAVLEAKLRELQKEVGEVKEVKKELEEKIQTLEHTIQFKENELETTKDDLFSSAAQNHNLNSQLTLINNLFSQMLTSPKVDLDRLTQLLKENHGLINELTLKGDSNEVAALLVDLAEQVDKEQAKSELKANSDVNEAVQEEISSNLSKVWRVMIELLSHHQNPTHTELAGGAESCYKCVQTPSGPRSVISVSQTFLTLKDLILEKNRLVKEVGRLKTLNNHLENRLGNQEKRLSVVTTELRKTWGVVNKLKAQHQQLHTHEKILRYELQQKRCMLTELKQELEHCRDKWEKAREKNTQTEEDWKKLRKEFALRKTRKESNSAESGYEEEDSAHSPPPEPVSQKELFMLRPLEGNEAETSEDDIENSDGNSFDTVIDLLDIAYLENHSENESDVPSVPHEVPLEAVEVSTSLLPLTSSEFTDGLDQIESEDLAAVLDLQYQNQLLGADYNLSLPSSSGSSPIPTETDDFASSEMDVSEEDSSSNSNNPNSSILSGQVLTESAHLCSASSTNISKFLDGLLVENPPQKTTTNKNLLLEVSNSSQVENESIPATTQALKDTGDISDNATSHHSSNLSGFLSIEEQGCKPKILKAKDITKELNISINFTQDNNIDEILNEKSSDSRAQEQILSVREERLKRLEAQCRSLVNKVTSTSFRSEIISNKLDELHLCYGSSDVKEACSKKELDTDCKEFDLNKAGKSSISSDAQTLISDPPTTGTSQGEDSSLSSAVLVQQRSPQQVLEARAARLKRLEDQCKSLFSKMSATSSRSDLISNKLDKIHDSHAVLEQHQMGQTCLSTCSSPERNRRSSCLDRLESQEDNQTLGIKEKNICKPIELSTESKEILNKCSVPGPSTVSTDMQFPAVCENRTSEQILEARAERFKRLEEQCKSLVSKMTATSLRSEIISNKLDELHSCYGSAEDACGSEDQRENRRKSSPTSSPRRGRKTVRFVEKDRNESSDDGCVEIGGIASIQETNANHDNSDCTETAKNSTCVAKTLEISDQTKAEDEQERHPSSCSNETDALTYRNQSKKNCEQCQPTIQMLQSSSTILNNENIDSTDEKGVFTQSLDNTQPIANAAVNDASQSKEVTNNKPVE